VRAAASDIIRLRSASSTMDVLHELAQGGAPAGTAVVAEEQTAGRGSRGRHWASPIGGLWLSVLSRPATAGLELVSLRAGLAVAELLERLGVSGRIMIKWPNDLMLDDRKTGGLLCEARWQGAALAWVVIGLGLYSLTILVRNILEGMRGHAVTVAYSGEAGLTMFRNSEFDVTLMDVQLRTEIPVFSAVVTPQQFHETAAHFDFFRRHFANKGVEVAQACAETLLSLERLRGQVAAGIVGCTMNTFGARATITTGTRSLSGS